MKKLLALACLPGARAAQTAAAAIDTAANADAACVTVLAGAGT